MAMNVGFEVVVVDCTETPPRDDMPVEDEFSAPRRLCCCHRLQVLGAVFGLKSLPDITTASPRLLMDGMPRAAVKYRLT